jgi:hypothetical protein
MEQLEYKLTNITKWPNVKKGKHRLGFIININRKSLHVGQHMVVPQINEGIENLQKRKFLKVEPIQNRHVLVREQIAETDKQHDQELEELKKAAIQEEKDAVKLAKSNKEKELEDAKNVSKNSEATSSLDKDALRENVKQNMPENNTRVSGGEGGEDPTSDLEEPTFADGEPNFMVRAGGNKKNPQRRS